MRIWHALLTLALICPLHAGAQEIDLKGGASVSGPIIAEKRDQVFVDLGFTILAIPRQQIVDVRQPQVEQQTVPAPSGGSGEVRNELYYTLREVPHDLSIRELVAQLGEAVVQVRTPAGLGSGFFLNEEGYLITNFHVIEGETEIGIEVYHQRNGQLDRHVYKEVRILAMNKFEDLALLRIEDEKAPKFAWVPLGQVDQLAVGERVFAVGSPLGLERTVTEGILSTKTREFQGKLYLQTTAQINPGNSGGPLFNLLGEVVGVTNMKIQFGEGIGFAIPVDAVKYFLKHRDAYAYDKENPSTPYRYLQPPSRLLKPGARSPEAATLETPSTSP